MASSAPELAPQQKKQLRDKDWEPWKDLVYTKFIVKNKDVDAVVAELDKKGFVVDREKLQSKLKSWGFRKKLEPNIWRYLSHVIQDRRNCSGKNTTVILSGRRIPQEKVENNISRHDPPRWNQLIPSAPPDELPLYLCTPRGSSTDLAIGTRAPAQYRYPKDLPWFQFLNTDFPVVLRGIQFLRKLPKKATSALAGPEATQELLQIVQCRDVASLPTSQKARILPAAFEQVVRRCLGIAIGSQDMAFQLLALKSIDRLAARFDMIFPQAFPDENLRRAATLAGGSVADIQLELLKVLLFLVSNGLILTQAIPIVTMFDMADMVDQARPIIGLCQFAGLSQLPTLRKLVDLSHRSLTITAIINTLFKAAVLTGAAGFVSNLLKADCRLRPDSMANFFVGYDRISSRLCYTDATPLEFALSEQYENLVKVLVDVGANLPERRWDDWSMLAVAIYEHSPDTLVQMLIHHGASINGYCFESVHAAFITGNLHLIERLVAEGAHLNHRYRASYLSETSNWSPFAMSPYFHLFRHLDDVGCLGFAASFHSATMTTKSDESDDLWETFAKDQDKALELCNAINLKYRPQMDLSDDRMVADAMIIASARGYTKVIKFLRQEFSASVNVPSGYLSPLYAAVGWKQVEATRLLLQLGAY
ncbi:ankyrin repeat-containing domain protein, partial [Cladorrhinum sp. PSN259]